MAKSARAVSSRSGRVREEIIAHLERDGYIALAAQVRSGMMSPRAAAIEAGFRKRPSVLAQLLRLWERASEAERAAFRERTKDD